MAYMDPTINVGYGYLCWVHLIFGFHLRTVAKFDPKVFGSGPALSSS